MGEWGMGNREVQLYTYHSVVRQSQGVDNERRKMDCNVHVHPEGNSSVIRLLFWGDL